MLSVWLETWWLFIACLPLSPTVKEFRKSVKIFRILSDICFGPWCIRHIFHCHESQIAPFVPYHLVSGIIFTFHVVSLNLITVPMHFIHGFHTTIFSDTRNFFITIWQCFTIQCRLEPTSSTNYFHHKLLMSCQTCLRGLWLGPDIPVLLIGFYFHSFWIRVVDYARYTLNCLAHAKLRCHSLYHR